MRDLIPSHIAYRRDLNQIEQQNIMRGQDWALARKQDLLSERFIKELHKRMFIDVWRWAGKFRRTERNIGIPFYEIPIALRQLLEDVRTWQEFNSYPPDEIAVRLHHRLVQIHPFPNGNGRHARLLADLLIMRQGRDRFSWGRMNLHNPGQTRHAYIAALQSADRHDITALLAFARS